MTYGVARDFGKGFGYDYRISFGAIDDTDDNLSLNGTGTLPAQNQPSPEQIFGNHVVAAIGNTIYDAAYGEKHGTGSTLNANLHDWQRASLTALQQIEQTPTWARFYLKRLATTSPLVVAISSTPVSNYLTAAILESNSIVSVTLGPDELQQVANTAIALWSGLDLDESTMSQLNRIQVLTSALPDSRLGVALDDGRIIIDDDAAGLGWFTELPLKARVESSARSVAIDLTSQVIPAHNYDLLTVVAHEVGHLLGFGHSDEVSAHADLMSSVLSPGERHLPQTILHNGIGSESKTVPAIPQELSFGQVVVDQTIPHQLHVPFISVENDVRRIWNQNSAVSPEFATTPLSDNPIRLRLDRPLMSANGRKHDRSASVLSDGDNVIVVNLQPTIDLFEGSGRAPSV